jgi:hypothetical protein
MFKPLTFPINSALVKVFRDDNFFSGKTRDRCDYLLRALRLGRRTARTLPLLPPPQ